MTYLIPVCTVGLSALFLGEVPTSGTLVGGAMCLVGVLLAQFRPRKVPDVNGPGRVTTGQQEPE